MEEGLVDTQGFPVGELYYMLKYEAIARDINIYSTKFENRRPLFFDLGIPACRIMTATPQLICTQRFHEVAGIPSDYDKGLNLPEVLK